MKENMILFHDLPLSISSISYSYYSTKITANVKNENELLKYLKKIIEENSLPIIKKKSINDDIREIEITRDCVIKTVDNNITKYTILISGIMLEILINK